MNNRIVYISWGPEALDSKNLTVNGDWYLSGPYLPIEYARITKNGSLKAVATTDYGTMAPTFIVMSEFDTIQTAVIELFEYRMNRKADKVEKQFLWPDKFNKIVNWTERNDVSKPKSKIHRLIRQWLRNVKQYDTAVWYAQKPNFQKKTGMQFHRTNVVKYFEGLPADDRQRALLHLRNMPAEVRTDLADYILKELGHSYLAV